jgi:carbamoyl-phosphate synthase large subunit
LQNADPVLGVDMSSTGEVGCLGDDLNEALLNALIATGYRLPKHSVLISSGDAMGKVDLLEPVREMVKHGYEIYATAGTAKFFNDNGVKAKVVSWPDEDKPDNVMDLISDHKIELIVNVPKNHTKRELTNGYRIRRAAIDHNIPLMTNVRLAKAFIEAFCAMKMEDVKIKSWQEYNS